MTLKKRLAAGLLAAIMAVSAIPALGVSAEAETLETTEIEVDYLATSKTVTIAGKEYETDITNLDISVHEKKLTKTDRKNIGKLKKLEELTFRGYGDGAVLKDLSFLKNCKKLKKLKIIKYSIEDYSALGELSSFTDLTFLNTSLTKNNAKQIGKLKNLRSLSIWDYSGEDLSALKNLTKLESLLLATESNYSSNKDLSKDLSFIKKMKNLKELDLFVGYATKLPSLGDLTKLEKLRVTCDYYAINGKIKTISGLDKLKNLKVLDLCDLMGFSVSDLSALAGLKNLEELDLFNINEIDVDTLARLPSLKSLGYVMVKGAESQEEAEARIKKIQESLPNCDVHGHSCY